MDIEHKHGALIIIGLLVAVFIGLIAWFVLRKPVVEPPPPAQTATTTLSQPVADEPQTITENEPYYEIEAEFPSVTPLPAEQNEDAIARMRTFIEDEIAQFKDNADLDTLSPEDAPFIGLDGERKYALGFEYETYTGQNTVSYVYMVYEDTLGAHPNSYFRTFTFNRSSGELLSLGDLFRPGTEYLEALSARTRAEIPVYVQEQAGALPDIEYVKSGTEPTAENFQNFYIEGRFLVIAFPPYQVGPYVLGSISIPLPLSSFKDILRSEYLPQ